MYPQKVEQCLILTLKLLPTEICGSVFRFSPFFIFFLGGGVKNNLRILTFSVGGVNFLLIVAHLWKSDYMQIFLIANTKIQITKLMKKISYQKTLAKVSNSTRSYSNGPRYDRWKTRSQPRTLLWYRQHTIQSRVLLFFLVEWWYEIWKCFHY